MRDGSPSHLYAGGGSPVTGLTIVWWRYASLAERMSRERACIGVLVNIWAVLVCLTYESTAGTLPAVHVPYVPERS